MNSNSRFMRTNKEQAKSVFTIFRDQAPVGRSIRLFGFVPSSAAAIDLNKEIGGPERSGLIDEFFSLAGILENPLTALGQDPEPTYAERRGDFKRFRHLGVRCGQDFDDARR